MMLECLPGLSTRSADNSGPRDSIDPETHSQQAKIKRDETCYLDTTPSKGHEKRCCHVDHLLVIKELKPVGDSIAPLTCP